VFEGELAEACAPSHYNIGLLAYGVLLGGTLSGKYLNGYENSKGRHTLFAGESNEEGGIARGWCTVRLVFSPLVLLHGHTLLTAPVARSLPTVPAACIDEGLNNADVDRAACCAAPCCAVPCCVPAGFQPRYHCKRAMAATQDVVDLAQAKGMSPATLAQAWAASR
jgi:hypothetical protein